MKGIKDTLKEKIALLRLRQGDTEAFGFIYDTYIERIYRYIYFRVSDTGLAHDISQEVFIQTWEYIVAQNTIDNLQSFLYRVAYHKIVDHYRSKERQAALLEEIREDLSIPETVSIEVDLIFLKKNIAKLKQEYQDVLLLRHVEGLSIAEIADIVEKEVNNVRVTLHRATAALKEVYEPQQTKTTT
jgi:RNA polymerase sigma-70 factor (ECF subfamily)